MKGFLYSQDGSYAFPLGPKVTTIGRENCDISINNPHVDNQHALMEYDDEQRCFILKDLNSSTGTYVHDCRVQNAAVRLAHGDLIRFGFHGLPLEFRIEQHENTMPPIYQRQSSSNSLQLINQTIPSRRISNGTITHQKPIDVQQNPGFTLRTRPLSAGTKKPPSIPTSQTSNPVRTNAWTISSTMNPNRSMVNGNFEMPPQDSDDLTNRVDQLEKEVKARDTEIRELNDRLRSLEPMSSTFTTEVHTLRSELEKVKREKQAATGLISSLQRDLHTKESDLAKLIREIEGLKTDSRDKDLRLQSLQAKLDLLRDRGRSDEDRYTKEKELVNLRNKIKLAEQQITELTESVNRLKSQLQDTDKQLLRFNQNEQKLKQDSEQLRTQLVQVQKNETKYQTDLTNLQKKYEDLSTNIWKCLSTDEDDEYDEDEHNLIEKLQQLREEFNQSKIDLNHQRQINSTIHEQLKTSFKKLVDLLTNVFQEQTTQEHLSQVREQILQLKDNPFIESAIQIIDHQTKTLFDLNNLINKQDLSIQQGLNFIRNQYDDFEREKTNLRQEQTVQEQRFRSELEKITAEKDAFWQQRFNEECDRLRQENAQLQREYDEQIERTNSNNKNYLQQLNTIQTELREKIEELQEYQRQLTEQKEQYEQLNEITNKQTEELNRLEKQKNNNVTDLNQQIDIYKDQVQQYSKTIIELEKTLNDEQQKRLKLQDDFDAINQNRRDTKSSTPPVTIETIVPILSAPVVDHSQELFTYKSRVQEQEQIILSLRRDLIGLNARLSDVQGELNEKQKRTLEKSEFTIREQTKELNETRLKLSKLSEIVDKQTKQIETLQTDLSKSKTLANQYQLLVDQRQADIDRLTKSLEQQNLVVERVEKSTQNEGRITHELVAIGAQCKGEKHEQTIGRQRQALNELRARIKSLEQLRPANPSYEKVFQQVVLLKRELAELRAKHALPTDLPYLTNSFYQSSTNSLNEDSSDLTPDAQKILQERTAHAETMNTLQSCDELYNSFIRKLSQLLDIEDETLLNISPLINLPTADRYVAIQQRQKILDILLQNIQILHERLARKEDLLRDYEKDLGKLRQAELLLREKDLLLQDLEIDKRSKDDETLYLRNTIKETQLNLNQEKRLNSSIKNRQNIEQQQQQQPQSNDLIRRTAPVVVVQQSPKRDVNQKLSRKDYEIKTLKQELHEALDTLAEQSNKVKLLEIQSKDLSNSTNYFSHNS